MLSISRRWFLAGSAATFVSPAASETSDAEPVGIILAVLSAIAGAITGKDTTNWQHDVNDKLDVLLMNSYAILADLKRLRADIRREIDAGQVRAITLSLLAKKEMLAISMQSASTFDAVSRDQIEKIRTIATETEKECFELISFGYGGYALVASGFDMIATMYRLLGYNKRSFSALCDRYIDFFSKCMDSKEVGSIQSSLDAANKYLAEYPKYFRDFDKCFRGCSVGRHPSNFVYFRAFLGDGGQQGRYSIRDFQAVKFRSAKARRNEAPLFPGYAPYAPNDVEAARRAWNIVGDANKKQQDLAWATVSAPVLTRVLQSISNKIEDIRRAKELYPIS